MNATPSLRRRLPRNRALRHKRHHIKVILTPQHGTLRLLRLVVMVVMVMVLIIRAPPPTPAINPLPASYQPLSKPPIPLLLLEQQVQLPRHREHEARRGDEVREFEGFDEEAECEFGVFFSGLAVFDR